MCADQCVGLKRSIVTQQNNTLLKDRLSCNRVAGVFECANAEGFWQPAEVEKTSGKHGCG
jgi:hypothetical protein